MNSLMDMLAFHAESRGTSAVSTFLRENRKDACALLEALAHPVLLTSHPNTAESVGKDTGVYMEQRLSVRAQRTFWDALVRLAHSTTISRREPLVQAALELARKFLQCAEKKCVCASDAACCSLAQMLVATAVSAEQSATGAHARAVDDDDDESLASIQRTAAFREAMKQLTFARLIVPPIDELAALVSFRTNSSAATSGASQPERPVLLRFTRVQPQTPSTTGAFVAPLLVVTTPTSADTTNESRKARTAADAELQPAGSAKRKRVGEHSLQRDNRTDTDVLAPAAPVHLSLDVEEKAAKLAKHLVASDTQTSRAQLDDVTKATVQLIQATINATTATQFATETLLARLCVSLQLAASSDEALFQIATALVESSWSSRHASVFLDTSVLPKIAAAASVISRMLLQTALLFSPRYTTALLDALLIPLLTTRALGAAQGEAITRILRNGVPLEQLDGFLSKSFELASRRDAAATDSVPTPHFFTHDAALMVLQNVLTMKAPLADATIDRFIACCEAAQDDPRGADALHKSLKFATLVFTMVSKYPEQCAAHAEALEAIAKRLTSLMAKSTMRAVLKLKTGSAAAR